MPRSVDVAEPGAKPMNLVPRGSGSRSGSGSRPGRVSRRAVLGLATAGAGSYLMSSAWLGDAGATTHAPTPAVTEAARRVSPDPGEHHHDVTRVDPRDLKPGGSGREEVAGACGSSVYPSSNVAGYP